MKLVDFKQSIRILDVMEAHRHRELYISKFIDINLSWYRNNIATVRQFSDGLFYTGYLWECIKRPTVIEEAEFKARLLDLRDVAVFWDLHSKDKILVPGYWKFAKHDVLRLDGETLLNGIDLLPDDIYVCDETFEWTLISTHEHNGETRIYIRA